ncbi:hypothetical protein [Nocardia farcinica]|uniref:hypothetical protein n=1 Tax=Nocardia farcinica TaxID=37329 RepID=UPI0034283FB2
MTTAVRPAPDQHWDPDPLLAAAALAGGIRLLDLTRNDQCWLVAHLSAAGLSGEEIASRCHCGVRKVRYLRADPLTAMITRWLIAQSRADAETARANAIDRLCRTNLDTYAQTTTRLRAQLDNAIAQIRDLHAACRTQQRRAERYLRYLNTPRPRPRPRHAHCVGQLALW